MSYRAPRETVGGIEVRGLALSDVTEILRKHRPVVESLFGQYREQADLGGVGETLLISAPEVAATILARATDDPEGEWNTLPAGLALMLLEAVGRLTFEAGGGVGKVLEVLVNAVEGTSNALTPSTIGSGPSDGTPPS